MGRSILVVILLTSATVPAAGQPAAVVDLSCTRTCVDETTTLTWTNLEPYDFILIIRDGTIIAAVPGSDSIYSDSMSPDSATYSVGGVVSGIESSLEFCNIGLFSPTTHVILDLDGGGMIDSVAALTAELTLLGFPYVIVSDVEQLPCSVVPGPSTMIWSMTGTFPDNTPLDPETGAWLKLQIESGGGVYHEGGDTWGFDLPTAFDDVDGVDSAASVDGRELAEVIGVDVLAGFDAMYTQDQAGNDFNDRIVPSSTDMAGPNAFPIWIDGMAGDPVGIFYATDPPYGKVLCQSFELGGYSGDRGPIVEWMAQGVIGRCVRLGNPAFCVSPDRIDVTWEDQGYTHVLITVTMDDQRLYSDSVDGTSFSLPIDTLIDPYGDYLFQFESYCGPSDAGGLIERTVRISRPYRRCDANGDGTLDVADAADLLSRLFSSGTPHPCEKAADCDKDNALTINDAVRILVHVFVGSIPPPEAPYPDCGVDPDDLLKCETYEMCP